VHPLIHAALADARARDLRGAGGTRARRPSRLLAWLRARRRVTVRPGPPLPEVHIRWAFADDGAELARLAAGSGDLLPAPVLLAEVDGRLGAALSLDDGRAVAAPARPCADALALLAVRASQLGARARATAPQWHSYH
jgi:hypothetical protein